MSIQTLIRVLSLVLLFTTCTKKGENDPEISLRTRKARLSGSWQLKSGSVSFTEGATAISYTFDGREYKRFTTYSGGPAVYYYGRYTLLLNLDKNGGASFTESILSNRIEQSGTWSFNTGNTEFEAKEILTFIMDKPIEGESNQSFFLQGSSTFVYRISELKNKSLTIQGAGLVDTGSGQPTKYTITYHFEQT